MHLFIFHLSIADLLVAVFNILPQLIWDITERFYGGDLLCRYIKFMQVYVMYLSTYMLVMTAVDRYRAVCHPLSAFNTSTRTPLYCMIVSAYVISGVLSLPQPIIFKYREKSHGSGDYECWGRFEPPWTLNLYITSFTFAVYIVPLAILIFAYVSICCTIWRKYKSAENERKHMLNGSDSSLGNRNIYSNHVTHSALFRHRGVIERRRNLVQRCRPAPMAAPRAHSLRGFSRAKLKTVKLTFVVIVAYVVCWSPFFLSQLWWLYDEQQEHNHAVVIMVLLASLNSCCNPWIYLAFSGNLIRHICPMRPNSRNCCCCDLRRCRRRQFYRRRSSSNNNHDDTHSPLSPSDERIHHHRDGMLDDMELRELIADGINRKRQPYIKSAPDTVTSKTVTTKTGTPISSTQLVKRESLHKTAVLQNGRHGLGLDWTHPLPNNLV
ncbi:unnamed protein product [Lymnaea stagnalis]